MEVASLKKLTTDTNYSNNLSMLIKFSKKMKCLIFLLSLKVKEYKVLLKDSVLSICKKKPIEVIEELDVLDLGIPLE